MAIYKALSDGNAPSGLKVGDLVTTNKGGTWQILDSNQYSGMSADALKAAGVSYNPATGYYSKQYTGMSDDAAKALSNYTSLAKTQNTDMLNNWKDSYINSQLAALQAAYNTNTANLAKAYNDSYKKSYDQIESTKNAYNQNIQDLYDSTYKNNALALQQAANRGLTSSAQGIAMGTSGLMNASKKASQLTADRDALINNIQSELNRLTSDYNIDKNTLEANFSADKIKSLSDAELQWLEAALQIENENNDIYNSYLSMGLQNQYDAEQAEIERQFQREMAEADYAQEEKMLRLQNELYNKGYNSGGGYYGGSGYYNRGSGSGGSNYSDGLNQAWDTYAGDMSAAGRELFVEYANANPNMSSSQANGLANFLVSAEKSGSRNTGGGSSSSKTSSDKTTTSSKGLENFLESANKSASRNTGQSKWLEDLLISAEKAVSRNTGGGSSTKNNSPIDAVTSAAPSISGKTTNRNNQYKDLEEFYVLNSGNIFG